MQCLHKYLKSKFNFMESITCVTVLIIKWFFAEIISTFLISFFFRLYTASGIDLALFCVKQEQFYITGAACPHASV